MHVGQIIITICIGLTLGFSSGLMGIGGGGIATPMLRLFLSAPPLIALATPFPVMLPSALSGTSAYFKERKIDIKLALWILTGALPCTWLGAYMTTFVSDQFLMVFTAIFLIAIGSSFFVRAVILKERVQSEDGPTHVSKLAAISTGAFAGFLAGLLAIGGGVLYVPAFVRFYGRPMKVALATSLFIVLLVSIPGTITHAYLGHIDWRMALILMAAALPAGLAGAKLALRLRNRTLERIFGIWTICFGIYFLISQL